MKIKCLNCSKWQHILTNSTLMSNTVTLKPKPNTPLYNLSFLGANCTVLTGTDVNLTVDENGGKTSSPKNWHARLIGQKKCDVIVGVFTPCNCIIGEWSLFISTKSKVSDNSVQVEEYECSTDINILLNPWCKGA